MAKKSNRWAREREKLPGYLCWTGMNARCRNPNFPFYHRYGGRGIKVCSEWQGRGGYERFIAHIGPRPSLKHQVDRIDNDGNYEPGNVRWVVAAVNNRNKGDFNHKLTCRGETKTITDWAHQMGCSSGVILDRLKMGCAAEEAIFTPLKPKDRPVFGEPASGTAASLLSVLPIGGSAVVRVSRQRVQQLAVVLGMRFVCEMQGMERNSIRVTRIDSEGSRNLVKLRTLRRA